MDTKKFVAKVLKMAIKEAMVAGKFATVLHLTRELDRVGASQSKSELDSIKLRVADLEEKVALLLPMVNFRSIPARQVTTR